MKISICVAFLLTILLLTGFNYHWAEEPVQPPQIKEVSLKTEAHWLEEKGEEIIMVRGETNLPPATQLKVELKAGIALFNESDNIQLVDALKMLVNNDGQYSVRFANFKTTFAAEYYEVIVSVSSDQPKDTLLSDGFSADVLNQAESYYLVNIFSPNISRRRQQSVTSLVQLINETMQLNLELMNKIQDIEKIKQGDSPIEQTLKHVFEVYKTKKELLERLSLDWATWEKDWAGKVNMLTRKLKDEKVCLGAATHIYNSAYKLLDYYHKYRREALDEKGVLKNIMLSGYLSEPLKTSEEIKKQEINILEKELVLKISRNILARAGEAVPAYQECAENKESANEVWSNLKISVSNYLISVRQELTNYIESFSGEGFFLETPTDKDKKKDTYKQMIVLIDLTDGLVEKLGLRLIDPTSQKLESDTHEILDLINLKAGGLLSKAIAD